MENEYLQIVRKEYPNALTTTETFDRAFAVLKEQYDIEPSQIMFADSICADDLNSIQYPPNAAQMLGPFKMGGLNGFPFTGVTGMGAYAGHVPDDGALFIYYAPHIGISKTGAIGEVERPGQKKTSGSCGAAKAALKHLLDGKITPGNVAPEDFQFNSIEQIFLNRKERIERAEKNPLIEATEVMYEAIGERIDGNVEKTTFNCQYLILMGGIMINGDHGAGSFNDCRRFEIVDTRANERKNLLDSFQSARSV